MDNYDQWYNIGSTVEVKQDFWADIQQQIAEFHEPVQVCDEASTSKQPMDEISEYGLGFDEYVRGAVDFIHNLNKMEAGKKRPWEGTTSDIPIAKKPRIVEDGNANIQQSQDKKQGINVQIGGMEFDISGLPSPVCSCTGTPHRCYRRGKEGWQSTCCTATISMYPLPFNPVRRGERIKGRKIGHNAFNIVLNKLLSEGYNFYKAIDLKEYWGKRGSNQHVIQR